MLLLVRGIFWLAFFGILRKCALLKNCNDVWMQSERQQPQRFNLDKCLYDGKYLMVRTKSLTVEILTTA